VRRPLAGAGGTLSTKPLSEAPVLTPPGPEATLPRDEGAGDPWRASSSQERDSGDSRVWKTPATGASGVR